MNTSRVEISSNMNSDVVRFASEVAGGWEPDPIYVIDICESESRMYLLEINAFSTSGLYDCDVKPIIEAAGDLAMEEWESVK